MRLFTMFFVLLISSFALAEAGPSLAAPGIYSYQGRYEISTHRHFEILDPSTNEGVQRQADLEKDGYRCTRQDAATAVCEKDLALEHDPLAEKLVRETYSGMWVKFGAVDSVKEIPMHDDFRLWVAQQKSEVTRLLNGIPQSAGFESVSYITAGSQHNIYPGGAENKFNDVFSPDPTGTGLVAFWLGNFMEGNVVDSYVGTIFFAKEP